jgi:hypothetical protein
MLAFKSKPLTITSIMNTYNTRIIARVRENNLIVENTSCPEYSAPHRKLFVFASVYVRLGRFEHQILLRWLHEYTHPLILEPFVTTMAIPSLAA